MFPLLSSLSSHLSLPLSLSPRYGVNCSSIIFTAAALVLSGDIPKVVEFMAHNPTALWYNIATAVTSTTGQIAIFFTIRRFGPVVFTVIMTTRQVFSIVLSTVLFQHPMSWGGVAGAALVFVSLFLSIFRQMQATERKAVLPPVSSVSPVPSTPSLSSLVDAGHTDAQKELLKKTK